MAVCILTLLYVAWGFEAKFFLAAGNFDAQLFLVAAVLLQDALRSFLIMWHFLCGISKSCTGSVMSTL